MLKIFKLIPVEETQKNIAWKASIYKGTMVIRCQNEARAREIAKEKTHAAVKVIPGQGQEIVAESPWVQEDLVSCQILEGTDCSGKEEVIEPRNLI